MWLMLQTWIDKIESLCERIPTASFEGFKISSSAWPMEISKQGTAIVKVEGPLMAKRDPMLDYFGVEHTAYEEIVSQVKDAESRGAKRGKLKINSPGGELAGMLSAMDAVRNSSIQWEAEGGDVMASAAYMLGSQASKGIRAMSELSLFGSIGLAISASTSPYRKEIANTDSPHKRPDATTEEGIGSIRSGLDDIFEVLAPRIADGRNTTAENVKKNFGQGAVFPAEKAKRLGLIDSVEKSNKPAVSAAIDKGHAMNLEELKAQHADAYKAAFEEGQSAERERVTAHLTLADASGDLDSAKADIKSGQKLDMTVQTKHMAAGMLKMQRDSRGAEAPPAIDGTKPAAGMGGKTETADLVKAELQAKHPMIKIIDVRG
jgi:ClpP class serine protease